MIQNQKAPKGSVPPVIGNAFCTLCAFRKTKLFQFAATIALAFTGASAAMASNWTGGGDGTTWTDAANWGGTLPSAVQSATIGLNANIVLTSGVAETANGLNLASAGVTSTLSISGAGTSLNLNNANINIATNSTSAVGMLNLTGVSVFNAGTSGGTNNRWGKDGGKATLNMNAATFEHSAAVNGELDLMENTVAGARVTFNLLNGSQFNWKNGNMNIGVNNVLTSADARAFFNIDSTSSMSFDNGLLQINGGEGGGMAVYDLPLGSSSGQAGKMYFKNGISGIAMRSNGAGTVFSQVTVNIDSTASDVTIGPDTFKRAASATPIDFNNSTFHMANATNAVGVLNLKQVTLTNVGTAGGTNNRLANAAGASATVNLDGASISHNIAAPSDLDLVTNGGNGARATLNLRNGSFINWAGGSLQIDLSAPTGVNSRAFLNVDSTSYMNFANGGLVVNGGESGGMAVYTIPFASAASTPGKMFFGNGLSGLAQAAGSQVTVNIDSTAADYLFQANTYKAAASATPINFNNTGFNIGQGANSIGALNLKQVTINNYGTSGGTNNRPGNSGGKSTVFMDASTITQTAAGTNLDSVNNGTTGGRFTLSLINGSHFNWGVGSMTIAANAGATTDSRANFNISADSKISFPTGGLIINGGETAASGGIAVYNLPLTSTSGALGKLFVKNGIQTIATITGSKVTVNVDSTAPDYLFQSNTYKAAADTAIDANNSALNIGKNTATGRLNLTSVTYSNVNQIDNGASGGNATISLTNATLSKNGSNSLFNGADTNTSTKAQILMDNGTINVAGGQSFINRNATTSASTMGSQVKGTGLISFASGGTFRNNGRVEADGGLLTISGAAIDSQLELLAQVNTGFYGQNGWYASAGSGASKLTLPALTSVGAGKTWGEASADATPELVNAVRFYNVSGLTGALDGSLLAVDHTSIPTGLVNPIGVWDFSTTGPFTSGEMTIRYDDALATFLGVAETDLKLFHYEGGAWVNITDGAVDTVNKRIDSLAFTSFSPFAVAEDVVAPEAVPEPSTYALGLFGLIGFGLFVRPRRRRS